MSAAATSCPTGGNEAVDGAGDRHAVNQQNRVDGEEVQQSNQFTGGDAEVLFYHGGDVFYRDFYRQNETAQAAGAKVIAKSDDGHDDRWNQTADAGVDWQEQDACADGGAAHRPTHPHGIRFTPGSAGT